MFLITPDYYDDFKCKASACTDNCCIGWEIDIDEYSDAVYSGTEGEFGQYLNSCIDRSGEVHFFKLGKNERCSLLDENNLCRIITNMGEENLCDICHMHPRFCSYFGNIKTLGLGLCCEEAARIIIENDEITSFEINEIDETNDEDCNKDIFDSTISIFNELNDYLRYCNPDFMCIQEVLDEICQSAEALQYYYSKKDYAECRHILYNPVGSDILESHPFSAFVDFLKTLEIMDSKWNDKLNAITEKLGTLNKEEKAFDKACRENNIIYANIAIYFLFRYFLDAVHTGDIFSPVVFTVFAVKTIKYCDILTFIENGGNISSAERVENAKLFSKEIEYSTENTDAIYNWFS